MLSRFLLCAVFAVTSYAADDSFSNVERIVAVGDLHGDYEQTLAVLQMAGVTDNSGKWTGGRTHLVQTGDITDRGPHAFKIMDLFMKLEKEARRARGRVHALLGNHEAMNLYGDLRYVSATEMEQFKTPDERATLLSPSGKYGKWLRQRPAVIKIDRSIFLHGGIGPAYSAFSVREINHRVRDELEDFTKLPNGVVMDEGGPLWFRGLVIADEAALEQHVNDVLLRHGVDRIVVGHSIVPRITARFGGKVIAIDVAMNRDYKSGQLACLLIEKGKPVALEHGQRTELPSPK